MTLQSLTFVVGTGRCGSTMFSQILRKHPDILSLSELFMSLEPYPFPEQPVTGEEFWRLLVTPRPCTTVILRDAFTSPHGQYTGSGEPSSADDPGQHATPAIALETLPHLTNYPEILLRELGPEIYPRPRGPIADHYRALFASLGERFGRHIAVERSAYSLRMIPRLQALFPEARFVHLYRSGPDTALSMSRHPFFQVVHLLRERAAPAGPGPDWLSAGLEEFFSDNEIDLRPVLERQRQVPVEEFGRLWSDAIIEGVRYLGELPESMRLSIAFEDLLDDPERELRRFAAYLNVEAPAEWLAAGRADIDSTSRGAAESLPTAELAALRMSCAPGMQALGL